MTCYVSACFVLLFTLAFVATFFWYPYNNVLRACTKASNASKPMQTLCEGLNATQRASIEHLALCATHTELATLPCDDEAWNALGNSFAFCQNGSCYKPFALVLALIACVLVVGCVRMQADHGQYHSTMPLKRNDLCAEDRDEYDQRIVRMAAQTALLIAPRSSLHHRKPMQPQAALAAESEEPPEAVAQAREAVRAREAEYTGITTVIDY